MNRTSITPCADGLLTDLYQLTMAQAYVGQRMTAPAVFELLFRDLPDNRNYLLTAGLHDALAFLRDVRFDDQAIDYLRRDGRFTDDFLDYLRRFRFTGDVFALREGTLSFGDEVVFQVIAPLPEAQLVETFCLNAVHCQTLLATKAARVAQAAGDKMVVDFGMRRTHGIAAAAARCGHIAGLAGTSNVDAGRRLGIPIFGTMAHSYIEAHDREADAFAAFVRRYPHTTLLIDTYDERRAVRTIAELAERDASFGIRAVRIDSGDLGEIAKQVRRELDEAGLDDVQIFASGGLDEYRIGELLGAEAPIDGFGVGTKMGVSFDQPQLDCAYKLVEYAGRPRMKLSRGKWLVPGRKQVFRRTQGERFAGDIIGVHDEPLAGQPLLRPVMRGGEILDDAIEPLDDLRRRAADQLAHLDPSLRRIAKADRPYPVALSDRLAKRRDARAAELRGE